MWEQRLMQWADALEKKVDKTADFFGEEVPLYVMEYLRWYIIEHSLYALMSMIAIGIFAYVASRCWRWSDHFPGYEHQNQRYWCFFFWGACTVGAIAAMGLMFFQTSLALKGYFAPRVVLVDKIQELVKGEKK